MRSSRFIYILLFLHWISPGSMAGTYSHPEESVDTTLLAPDGPYLIHLPEEKVRMVSVRPEGKLIDTVVSVHSGFSMPVYSHTGNYLFDVSLHSFSRPEWQIQQPEKLFVTSDPHGDWDSFSTLLQAHGVVNERWEWSYGNNHLMVIGDIFDRGDDVLPLFWLLYKLEEEAQQAGGNVSFLIGNHEAMVLGNDLRYVKPKYVSLADTLGMSYPALFNQDTELGRWLATRNLMHKAGNLLFVHAGLSEEFLKENLSIPEANEAFSQGIFMEKTQRNEHSPLVSFLYGSKGPIWYRGMVSDDEKYFPLDPEILVELLGRYEAEKIIVGHTIFPDISSFYDGSVIDVNVSNRKNRAEDKGRAILIEKDRIYVLGNTGIRKDIPLLR